jgi:5-formyltetrahydrofolate cyclo-ligase
MVKMASLPIEADPSSDSSVIENHRLLEQKRALRQQFHAARQSLLIQPTERTHAHARIQDHLRKLVGSGLWAAYLPMADEVDLTLLTAPDGQRWAYPVLYGESLQFFIPQTPTDLAPNRFGILEPRPLQAQFVALSELNGVLVPGVAFDRYGTRLGMGRGFYDRALQAYQGLKIGVAYTTQVSQERLPRDPHDIRMTHLVTPEGLQACVI